MSWFRRSDPTDEQRAALVLSAEAALAVGVTPALREWRRLSVTERAAWLVAAQRREVLDQVRLAVAVGNLPGAAELAAAIDGGTWRTDAARGRERRTVNEAAAALARGRAAAQEGS